MCFCELQGRSGDKVTGEAVEADVSNTPTPLLLHENKEQCRTVSLVG